MDTPERGKNSQTAAASNNKFEDSPVFSYINSLSPIKPVRSIPVTQAMNHLTFASLPSVFTSPHHVISLKESRFLPRHHLSDPSRPEFQGNVNADDNFDNQKENLDPKATNLGVADEPSYEEYSKLIVEFTRNLEYDNHISYSNLDHVEAKFVTEYATNSSELVPLRDTYRIIDRNKEATSSCDWEDLISDPFDLLISESPNATTETRNKEADPAMNFYTSIKHAIRNTLSRGPMVSENLFTQPREESRMMECENMDHQQHQSGLYRGVKRRSLVFEMTGARLKPLTDNSSSDSSTLRQSIENISTNQKPVRNSSQHALPGIGLHLNALARTPTEDDIVNRDSSASRRLLIGPGPVSNFHPLTTSCQDLLGSILPEYSLGDSFPELKYTENGEMNTSSSKKKRSEQVGEGETSCKRCNCKKSKCLKLYCECFAAGVYCVEPCACIDCFNKPVHEDNILATRKQIESRNPLAFAPKVVRDSDSLSEIGDDFSKTPASARHKRGCNCKKSGCLKKYCECYQGGVGCSINCRCEGCKNAFGRKAGSGILSANHEFEEDESNTTEKAELNVSFRKISTTDNLERSIDSTPLATPLRTGRQLSQPFSSKKRPHISSFPSEEYEKSTSFFPPPPKFRHLSGTVNEDEIPEFLLESSPKSGIKSLSPNGKRVSPPQLRERSPAMRSSRKLILQSIPSFPSLTNNQ